MKKALHYFQKQALQYSDEKYNSAAYLSPRRNQEPQQHHPHSHNRQEDTTAEDSNNTPFLFSTTTTAMDNPHQRPQHNRHHSSYASTNRNNRNNIPPTPPRISANIQRIQYASDHIRQSYELYLCPQPQPQASSSSPSSSTNSTSSSTPSLSKTPSGTATPDSEKQYWVLYVPGTGHMHDPSVGAASFHPALSLLTAESGSGSDGKLRDFQRHVRGYVSVNYRVASNSGSGLASGSGSGSGSGFGSGSGSGSASTSGSSSTSASTSAQQELEVRKKTAYETDNATFSDAVADVLAAIRHWQAKFPDVARKGRWVLAAHGFGAVVALNALLSMRDPVQDQEVPITPPRGVICANGVYDLSMLHRARGEFEKLTRDVLPDKRMWGGREGVSPAGWGRGRWRREGGWAGGMREMDGHGHGEGDGKGECGKSGPKWLILAHSREDKLVSWAQAEAMGAVFDDDENDEDGNENEEEQRREGGGVVKQDIMCEVLEIKGRHNECWETGRELARVVREGVGEVLSVDQ